MSALDEIADHTMGDEDLDALEQHRLRMARNTPSRLRLALPWIGKAVMWLAALAAIVLCADAIFHFLDWMRGATSMERIGVFQCLALLLLVCRK